MRDVIEAGLIEPPLKLEKMYMGTELEAVVLADGSVEYEGKAYESLSAAGTAARQQVNGMPADSRLPTGGWTFWRYRDPEGGELREIDALRRLYLAKIQANKG